MTSDYMMLRTGVKTLGDFQKLQEEFDLKKATLAKTSQGSLPAALQLANEHQAAIAAGDIDRANAIEAFAKTREKNVMLTADGQYVPLGGMPEALGQLKYGENYGGETATQQVRSAYEPSRAEDIATRQANVDLQYRPEIREAEDTAAARASRKADLDKEVASSEKVLPIIEELRALNESSPSIAYAGKTQWLRRLYPGTSPEEAAVDLMRQARLDLASPLAKELGVNPTDKDFQASLDRIFDIEATKDSRGNQIDALYNRKVSRINDITGGGLDPMEAQRRATQGRIDQGFDNPYVTLPDPYTRAEQEFNQKTGRGGDDVDALINRYAK
jgi:hypothetical protein